jgi:hypothetical protein
MRGILVLLVLEGLLVLQPGGAQAVPNCSQVDTGFCVDYPNHTTTIEFQGDCGNQTRQWRCCWKVVGACAETGPWTSCDCMLAGTPITLADGSTKMAEEIQKGNRVLSYDESDRLMKVGEVIATHRPFTAAY